jgi:CubicO group peptidase (beta-lactamase class C family)
MQFRCATTCGNCLTRFTLCHKVDDVLKGWNRIETWLTLGVAGVGLILLGVAGLWVYVSAAAKPLHPSAQDAPSATRSEPPANWAVAVEQARQIARAGLSDQNLPGLSVAVAAGNQIVWAEGFGWTDIETRKPVAPDTRFRIGTASTPLTAAAAGLLVEQGRLNLDDPIEKYAPEFPKKEWPITVRR